MAVQLFQRKKPTLWPGGLSVPTPPPIELDASVREEHGVEFAISDVPIEGGATVTDHVLELPQSLTIDVVATAHTDTLIPNVQATRHIRLYNRIVELARMRLPFDIVTGMAIYTNMLIQRVRAPRVDASKAIIITMHLRKLEIALIDTAQIMADAMAEIALGEQDMGAIAAAAEAGLAA